MSGDPFPRRPVDTAESLGRWAAAAMTGPVRLLAHQLWWTAARRLDDDELTLPDLDRPHPGDPTTIQRAAEGVGDLHVRRYRLVIATDATVAAAVAALADLDDLTPRQFVRFHDGRGRAVTGPLVVGDQFVARITGPRDGPVRVVDVAEDGFTLVTLRGHVEAGEIRFRVERRGTDRLLVEVRSWARSGARGVWWLYERGGGHRVQAHVWASLCLALAGRLGGRVVSRVEIASRRLAWPPEVEPGSVTDAA